MGMWQVVCGEGKGLYTKPAARNFCLDGQSHQWVLGGLCSCSRWLQGCWLVASPWSGISILSPAGNPELSLCPWGVCTCSQGMNCSPGIPKSQRVLSRDWSSCVLESRECWCHLLLASRWDGAVNILPVLSFPQKLPLELGMFLQLCEDIFTLCYCAWFCLFILLQNRFSWASWFCFL